MLLSSLYVNNILLPVYTKNITECLRKIYRLLIRNVDIILRKSNSPFYQRRGEYEDTG